MAIDEIRRKNGEEPTELEIRALEQDDALAHEWICAMYNDIVEIWEQNGTNKARKRKDAWKENDRFVRWLGEDKVTSEEIRDVRRRIKNIRRIFIGGITYMIDSERRSLPCKAKDKDGNYRVGAWVGSQVTARPRIHLCPGYFNSQLAQVGPELIVHELVHKLGFFGKRHGGLDHEEQVDRDAILELAKDNPRKARKSPSNYARLASSYYDPLGVSGS